MRVAGNLRVVRQPETSEQAKAKAPTALSVLRTAPSAPSWFSDDPLHHCGNKADKNKKRGLHALVGGCGYNYRVFCAAFSKIDRR